MANLPLPGDPPARERPPEFRWPQISLSRLRDGVKPAIAGSAGLFFVILVFWISPVLSNYGMMNLFLFAELFAFGYWSAALGGQNIHAGAVMFFIIATVGLLNGSFRPEQQIRKLRTYMRLRDNLVVESTQAIHHMQKALFEMNVQLSNVISDITGESSLRILEAILAGERDPGQLASLCSTRIKATRQTVAKALHWDEALLFCLKTALEIYRFSQNKIEDCDKCIERQLATFEIRTALPKATGNLRMQLHQISI